MASRAEVEHLGGAEKCRGQRSLADSAIRAMDIMLITLKVIANGNLLQVSRLGWK